jgi:membrane-associated protein
MVLFGSLESLLLNFSYVGIFLIVFAESGLFFGFFLPGDSLLFTAGLLARQGFFDYWFLLLGVTISAVLGDQVGYWSGNKFGRRFFTKSGDFFRDPVHIREAEDFYAKHGKIAIVLARFVPVVRTFAPIVAGIGRMDYHVFLVYNVVGGFFWASVMISAGFIFGVLFPDSSEFLTVVILLIIGVSVVPVLLNVLQSKKVHYKNLKWPLKKQI